jgi:enoyl-CoA hydratase/3-hydroxyacyl-CoA dehydrogenase
MDIFAVEINEAVKLIEQGIAIPDDIEKGIQYGLNRPFGPISVAKNINVLDIKSRLIEISNRWDCKMFEPANSIKIGSYPF